MHTRFCGVMQRSVSVSFLGIDVDSRPLQERVHDGFEAFVGRGGERGALCVFVDDYIDVLVVILFRNELQRAHFPTIRS